MTNKVERSSNTLEAEEQASTMEETAHGIKKPLNMSNMAKYMKRPQKVPFLRGSHRVMDCSEKISVLIYNVEGRPLICLTCRGPYKFLDCLD
ncbi:hypothetical protein V6N11_058453 [Hibiscus sabdariffa]|uniref:Uncharacterized protein n=1 Tax=Hibiscus sabdariffa TaxID=183260 RepID=A0ABR2U519_9ROSI